MSSPTLRTVVVRLLQSGVDITLQLENTATIFEAKIMISSKLFTNPQSIELLFNNRVLYNETQLSCLLFAFFLLNFCLALSVTDPIRLAARFRYYASISLTYS